MSVLHETFKIIIANEKGYWAGNGKGSGETYAGIDRNQAGKNWEGWKILDKIRNKKRFDIFPQVTPLVASFYKSSYFPTLLIGNPETIHDQHLANLVLDFLVHKSYAAVKVINLVAKSLLPTVVTKQRVTPEVISVMNTYPVEFYAKLRAGRIDFYNNPDKYNNIPPKTNVRFSEELKKHLLNERMPKFPMFITPVKKTARSFDDYEF